ncbi:LysE family translocator [Streptosporangium sp. NPDC048865]|uniref:LysE family translocator n=1 Tax=Streptosporangium sp. NPDC048865 TaxID=3155766 RepID=UPI00343CB58B
MVHPYAVAGFLVALLPLIATPGASLALLVRQVTEGGRGRAVPVVLGTVTGLYVHAALATAGLSALVMHSSQAFTAVKLAGAAYLVGLGVWTWRSAVSPASPVSPMSPALSRPHRRLPTFSGSPYLQALLANVLNPKAASIYLTLMPQFVTPGEPLGGQILTLATAHALLVALWLLGWTVLVGRAAHALRSPRFKELGAKVTAVVLIALGIRSATV